MIAQLQPTLFSVLYPADCSALNHVFLLCFVEGSYYISPLILPSVAVTDLMLAFVLWATYA